MKFDEQVYPSRWALGVRSGYDGQVVAVGGFGLLRYSRSADCGFGATAVRREAHLCQQLPVAGVDGAGLGLLLTTRQIGKMISSLCR